MAIALLIVSFAAVASLGAAQSDTYWQLRAGRDFAATGHVPLVDTYSHTVTGAAWPNHSWAWQVAAYALFRVGGFPLLTLANAVIATAALVISFRLVRGDPVRSFVLLLLAVPLLATTVALRPQVTSVLLLSVLLWMLSRDRVWWIPLLFLVWANVHGAVVIGGLVLASATGLALFGWLTQRSAVERTRARNLLVITVLSAAATLLTPLGSGLWSYIVTSVPRSRRNGIEEWASSLHWGLPEVLTWILICLTAVLAVRRWRTLRGWREQVIVVAALSLAIPALSAARNVPFFTVAALPACMALVRPVTPGRREDRRRAHTAVVAAAAVVGGGVVLTSWAVPLPRLGWAPIEDGVVAAVRDCRGPLYNTYGQGGFLIWFAPEVPVFLDSRQDPYPQDLIDEYMATETTGDYARLFAEYRIACAALTPDSPTATSLGRDGWIETTRTGGWVVLTRPIG